MIAINPMEQFAVHNLSSLRLLGLNVSFTNSSLWMMISAFCVLAFTVLSMGHPRLVPERFQSFNEMIYEFVAKMVRDNVGLEKGQPYIPYVFTLFTFILAMNVLGMIPFGFTVTSQIIVTFVLAIVSLIFVVSVGVYHHGFKFLRLFAPQGVPVFMLPLITPIELISYLARPFTLSIRLFANMLAGHTMIFVFAAFVGILGILLGWLPIVFIVALYGLELLVAVLQAYVFAVLVCIYLGEAVACGHGH